MIHPSYSELIKVVNQGAEDGKKPLSIAIDELYKGQVKIMPEEEEKGGEE